ncbi:hypothetical protein AGDE_02295 [Angomonas deanei]|uniref:MIZ/SP-RING zinc finger containing protein, putative n=1 Tax=Angomonas deanei TaxID=59799 RepID=S9VLE5_9TRYP|nr:hypothetical protein AGDE_07752 [Angomonas deanei]EPY41629.1 hypothetical protein AGDE_02295 [Angomonas deanei]CAD2216035.1 MIZ/SP-RING zinc finger containing protein, putative [Angomonas deanei]|eukprot:EPY34884.1 hypothetical protein AGDE_07752 [Angomonas deanei]
MEVPVRSRDCHHVQCCDVNSWVVLLDKARALRDPVGSCPVCKKRVAASSLAVDLWVLDVEKHLPRGTHLVILESDGTYRSADSVREKRREMVTEVVDATQSDYVNHFGEIIEEEEDDFFPSDDLNPVESVVCSIRPSASFEPVFMDERSMVEEMSQKRPRVAEEGGNTPLRKVKLELTDMPPPSPPVTASQDDGVTIVSYVESSNAVHRTLPSQLRLWELHCPHCGAVLVKGEDGSMRQCARCQEKGELLPADLILVRRFEENPSVSLELHPDGTCLLSGVDEAAPYLIRAGYHRSPFVYDSAAPSLFPLFSSKKQDLTKNKGVWSSTLSLTRFEMDFLEACCHRIARGERLEEMDYRMVPSVFRIPRRRPPNSAASSPFASQFNGSKNTLGNYNNNGVRDGYPS